MFTKKVGLGLGRIHDGDHHHNEICFSGLVFDVRCVFLIECKEGACQPKLDKYVDLLLRL